jgi:DHA2 family multidrug resistance protein
VFWASSMLFLVLIGFVWLSRPVRSNAPVDAGGAH